MATHACACACELDWCGGAVVGGWRARTGGNGQCAVGGEKGGGPNDVLHGSLEPGHVLTCGQEEDDVEWHVDSQAQQQALSEESPQIGAVCVSCVVLVTHKAKRELIKGS